HWIRVEDVPAIWRALENAGLSTQEACGDCPRVILGSPVAGVSAAERIDATGMIDEITARYIGDKAYSNLPRKFKTAISWLPDIPYECNDISFLGAVHPEHGPGYDLWVGGGLSTNPMLAKRLGTWIAPHQVPDVWAAVTGVFRDYGYRRLRHRARLKFLVNDWGVAKFRQIMQDEYLGFELTDLEAPPVPDQLEDHIGVHRQADGKYYIGAAPTVGRVSGTLLSQLADVAERFGSGRVRTTPMQKLLVLDVAEADVDGAVAALADIGLSATPSGWRRSTMACTGIEYCKLAIVDTKDRATALVAELERRVPELDVPISVHVNGCPNACARTQTADIGLKGQLMTENGKQVPGFQVHLGGGHGVHAGFGRKLRGLKVSSAELGDYITRLARSYLDQREDGEAFAAWVVRAEEANLR
ncbi:MAG: nitrite/sulfite reductase, partial [Stackebrandtia sp.]